MDQLGDAVRRHHAAPVRSSDDSSSGPVHRRCVWLGWERSLGIYSVTPPCCAAPLPPPALLLPNHPRARVAARLRSFLVRNARSTTSTSVLSARPPRALTPPHCPQQPARRLACSHAGSVSRMAGLRRWRPCRDCSHRVPRNPAPPRSIRHGATSPPSAVLRALLSSSHTARPHPPHTRACGAHALPPRRTRARAVRRTAAAHNGLVRDYGAAWVRLRASSS